MAESTTTQIIKEDPAIQTYKENLLKQVNDYIQDQLTRFNEPGQGVYLPPDYQVAEQNQLQQKASAMAQAGVGMYAPYLQRGSDLSQLGAEGVQTYGFGGLQDAFGATREGQSMLGQAAARANEYRNTPFAYQQRAANYLQGASGLGRDALGTGRSDIQSAIQQANRGQDVANDYLTGALDVGRGAMARFNDLFKIFAAKETYENKGCKRKPPRQALLAVLGRRLLNKNLLVMSWISKAKRRGSYVKRDTGRLHNKHNKRLSRPSKENSS